MLVSLKFYLFILISFSLSGYKYRVTTKYYNSVIQKIDALL